MTQFMWKEDCPGCWMDERWEAGERPGKRSVRIWLLEMPCSDTDPSRWLAWESVLSITLQNWDRRELPHAKHIHKRLISLGSK